MGIAMNERVDSLSTNMRQFYHDRQEDRAPSGRQDYADRV